LLKGKSPGGEHSGGGIFIVSQNQVQMNNQRGRLKGKKKIRWNETPPPKKVLTKKNDGLKYMKGENSLGHEEGTRGEGEARKKRKVHVPGEENAAKTRKNIRPEGKSVQGTIWGGMG